MKVVFLDAKSIGEDMDLSEFDAFGEVIKYDFSTETQYRALLNMLYPDYSFRLPSHRPALNSEPFLCCAH